MKLQRFIVVMVLGVSLTLTSWLIFNAKPLQAIDIAPTVAVTLKQARPLQQRGTGFVRVASSGVDTLKCGPVFNPCRTIQQAVDLALPGESILIAGGTYTGVQNRLGLDQLVFISKTLTLRGGYNTTNWRVSDPIANPTILNAERQGRVIFISDTVATTLENLMVTQGVITGNGLCTDLTANCGGGILATGPLTLNNVSVINNQSFRFGGGMATLSDTVIIGGRVEQNTSLGNSGYGGGLYSEGALRLTGVTFAQNTARAVGGGLYVRNKPMTIFKSLFVDNHSFFNAGGGLYISFDTIISGTVDIASSTFLSNTAGLSSTTQFPSGGGISAFNVHFNITKSHFENNYCLATRCDGGGLAISGNSFFVIPMLYLTGTDFINNRAGRNGGGIYNFGQTWLNGGLFAGNVISGGTHAFSEGGGGLYSDEAIISGTHFLNNISGEDGAGALIRANRFSSTLRLSNSYFEHNVAGNNGGGLAFGGSFLSEAVVVQNTQFISNQAGLNGGGWQSGTNFGGATITIQDSYFANNQADGPENDGGTHIPENGGGGAWVGGDLTLSQTRFMNNLAQTNGGGLHVRGNSTITDSQFEQNEALGDFSLFTYGGGGLYTMGSLTMTQVNLVGNEAFFGGGAWVNGDLLGQDSQILTNQAGRSGGGIQANGHVTLTQTWFLSNTAQTGGAGLSTADFGDNNAPDTLIIAECLFRSNQVISTALGAGGAALQAFDILTATNSQFIDNHSVGTGGGAVAGNFTAARFVDALFQGNTTQGSGGGLQAFLSFTDTLVLHNTQFLSNTAHLNGGGISTFGGLPVSISDSRFQANQALTGQGGGLSASNVMITNTHFYSNSAGTDGGGLRAGNVHLTGSLLEQNRAFSGDGGGLSSNSEIILNNTTALNNRAASGGGLHTPFRATLIDSLITANKAITHGGGLYVGHQLIVTKTRFVANAAQFGGGIYRTGRGRSQVVNTLLARNQATVAGDALYITLNTALETDLIHTTIASPTKTDQAAIFVDAGTVNITNTIIANHKVGIAGSAGGNPNEDFNLFFANGTDVVNVTSGGNSLRGNPAFVSPPNDDYRLSDGSAALNNGLDLGVPDDFFGDPRPLGSGTEIGFDEALFVADLAVQKSVYPAVPVRPGDAVTYTITFHNQGDGTATGLRITDTIPLSLTNLSIGSTIPLTDTGANPAYSWQAADLPPKTTARIIITGHLSAGLTTGGVVTNTVSLSTTQVEHDTLNNTSSVSFTIAQFGLSFAADQARTAFPGETVVYSHRLTNTGNITDTYAITAASNNGLAASLAPALITLPPQASTLVTLTATTPLAATPAQTYLTWITTSSTFSTGIAERVTDHTVVIFREADLSINKTRQGHDPVSPGAPIIYTIAITNHGPHTVDAVLTDTFTGLTLSEVTIIPETGSCHGLVSPLVCHFTALPHSATHITTVFTISAAAGGVFSSSTVVAPANGIELAPADNQTSLITVTVDDLSPTDPLYTSYLPMILREPLFLSVPNVSVEEASPVTE